MAPSPLLCLYSHQYLLIRRYNLVFESIVSVSTDRTMNHKNKNIWNVRVCLHVQLLY